MIRVIVTSGLGAALAWVSVGSCADVPTDGDAVQLVRSCTGDCGLEVSKVVRLGDREGPGYLARPFWVERRSGGDWIVSDMMQGEPLKVFAKDGTFQRVFGRRGSGPGEFRGVSQLRVLAGDSVEVVDWEQLRIATFTPSLEVVDTRPVGRSFWNLIAFLPDGRHVVAGGSRGEPLHLIDRKGRLIRSFGSLNAIDRQRRGDHRRRYMATSADGSVWSARLLSYSIERWDSLGTLRQGLVRNVEWFPPQEGIESGDVDSPPTPYVKAIHEDEAGLLWVAILVPDDEWREGLGMARLSGRPVRRVSERAAYYDTMIEAIDPSIPRVVRAARVDVDVDGFTSEGHVFSVGEENGAPVVDVWEIRTSGS